MPLRVLEVRSDLALKVLIALNIKSNKNEKMMNRREEWGWKLALLPVQRRGPLRLVFILTYFESDIFGSQPRIENKQRSVSAEPTSARLTFQAGGVFVRALSYTFLSVSRCLDPDSLGTGSNRHEWQPEMSCRQCQLSTLGQNCTHLRATQLSCERPNPVKREMN